MSKETFKVGDLVEVMDEGLLMLQKFAPPGAKPNNQGKISRFARNGYIEVEFPLEGENHSQAAIYPKSKIKKLQP